MSIKFTKLSQILFITAIASFCSVKTMAQTKPEAETASEPISLNEAFEKTYFEHTGNAFKNDSFLGQLNHLLGFTLFPDKQIVLDAKSVDRLYRYGMKQQTSNGVAVKTIDLQNPYETSLQENPEYISE